MDGRHDNPEEWVTEIFDVIAKADFVRTKYKQNNSDTPFYSVDDYIQIIEELTGYEITVTVEDWESYHIRGGCLNYEGNIAKIAVARHRDEDPVHGVTYCDQRYIAMKEAGQLLIDDDDSYIDNCIEFINDILVNNISITDFRKPGRSDIFYGKIFAMELLFPWEYRAKAKAEIENGEKTSYQVAQEFMIPEKELLWFLNIVKIISLFLFL